MTDREISAGDWLEHSEYGRVRVSGFDEDGDPVFTLADGQAATVDFMDRFSAHSRPLPGCTGWDWVEPTTPVEHCESTICCPDCGEFRGHGHEDICPMAWVTQDQVPARPDIDEIHWSDWPEGRWVKIVSKKQYRVHGEKTGAGSISSIRCRRQDLPVSMTLQSVAEVCGSTSKASRVTQIESTICCPDCGEFLGHGHEDICPMAWVEITDPEHVLRKIDQMDACGSQVKAEQTESWIPVIFHAGDTVAWWKNKNTEWRFRCRRQDLPVPMTLQSVADVCDPESPFGDAMTEPNRIYLRLFVPRRVVDDPDIDYPVRCCWSQSEIKDVATWIEVKIDGDKLYVEGE